MKSIALGEVEWQMLAGLPHLQFRLYMVLRWHMNRGDGIVGAVRRLSLLGLAEETEVLRVQGRHASETGKPSKKSIISALAQLEQVGLIESRGNGDLLVFLMPKAPRASARPKYEGHMRGTDEGHDEGHENPAQPPAFAGYEGHDEGHTSNPYEGHTSRVKVNPLYTPGVVGSLRAREIADFQPEEDALARVGRLCRKLRLQGIEATPGLFAHPDWTLLLNCCTDDDIFGAAALAKLRKPENVRLHLNYLKPILQSPPANSRSAAKPSRTDRRADFFTNLGIGAGNGTRRHDERVVDAEAHRVD